ncbi:MAG: hypothetical protein ACRDMV_03725 [Streptosporangiales bacterium]
MPKVIVPVGLNMGQDFAAEDPTDHPAAYWQVHFGTQSADLTTDEVKAWGAAFLDPAKHANHEVNRESLESRLRESNDGLADPSPVVSQLLDRGLLAEFDPVDGPLEDLFSRLQLFPLVQGLGNTPENPERYQIGIAGEPVVEVPANVYAIWSYSLTGRSLWHACSDLAEGVDADLAEGEEPLGLTADNVAREVGAALPVLVASGCGFLDPLNYEL